MTAPRLRPYQEQALTAEADYCAEHPEENRLLIEMATGLGKSITLGERARRFLDSFDGAGQRVLILVHTDELVRQLAADARMMAASQNTDGAIFSVGIVKASQDETTADIIVGSVATLADPARRARITDVGLIIIDEAHHATARTYVEILEHFGAMPCPSPGSCTGSAGWCWDWHRTGALTPVLGFTATPARSDGAGLGTVWHNLIFSRNITWGQRHGYLVDCVPYAVRVPDVTAAGAPDDHDAQLAEGIAPEAVVKAWLDKTLDPSMCELVSAAVVERVQVYDPRPSTVLFAPLVRSAEAFAEAFRLAGVSAEVIHGAMSDERKAYILGAFRKGKITVLCNAMMMTEGVNIPRIKCVVWTRPLRKVAAPLLIQGVGRGLRPWIGPDAPPREEQFCTLLMVTPESAFGLAGAADLSDGLAEGADGKSLLQMADEFDLGKELDAQEAARLYRGPVAVERWDSAVQASSKAWKYTAGGVPFLPTAKRGLGYVFAVECGEEWQIWTRRPSLTYSERMVSVSSGAARDLEMALAIAEDVAQEHGGDVGRLLADKGRAWRRDVPSPEMTGLARSVGVPEKEIGRILTQRAGGKAGKLSDLIDTVVASRVLDPVAKKIKERA